MANTGWITPDTFVSNGNSSPGFVEAPLDLLAIPNDGLYADILGGGFIGTANPSDNAQDTIDIQVSFSGTSVPIGAHVTGLEFAGNFLTVPVGAKGVVLPPVADAVIIDTEIYLGASFTIPELIFSRNHANGSAIRQGDPLVTSFGTLFWGGNNDDWGPPSIPSDRAWWSGTRMVVLRFRNVGQYNARVWCDYFAVRIYYIFPTFSGSGSTAATVQRGIVGAKALSGAGATAVVVNGISANRQLAASMSGFGKVGASVRLDNAGVIGVYGFPEFVGSGVVATQQPIRALAPPGAFAGSGVVATVVQRGIKLVAAFAGHGVCSVLVNRAKAIIGALSGTGTVFGEATRFAALVGSFVGGAVTDGTVFVLRQIAGIFDGGGVVDGGVLRGKPISADMSGAGVVDTTVNRAIVITAAMVGTAVTTGDAFAGSRQPAADGRQFVVPGPETSFVVPGQDTTFIVPA